MFLDVWDIRLEISVVSAHVNLNGLSVHVKNRKMENRPVHSFGSSDLNKTMGKMCSRLNSKTYTGDKICHFHLTRNSFDYCMRRFFFGLVYVQLFHTTSAYSRSGRINEK